MSRTILALLIGLACGLHSLAQKKQSDTVRKYLDSRLAFTNKSNMVFPALAFRQGDHWLLMSVYADTSVLLRAWFKDENCTVKDGPFTLYHPQKIKAAEGSFIDNIKQGVWRSWYVNGQLKDSGAYYNNYLTGTWYSWNKTGQLIAITSHVDTTLIKAPARSMPVKEKRPSIMSGDTTIAILDGPAITFYPNGNKKDSGAYQLNRKQGAWQYWYPSGQPESAGPYTKNVKEGYWEYYRLNGARSTREKYVNNKVTALECFDENGQPSGSTCPITKPPVPLGRFMDFDKYALDNMFWPEELKRSDIQGDVKIQYTITKEGKLENLNVVKSPHKAMSEEVIRFFKTLEWSPAVSHNRPIDYTTHYTVPFYR